jgi:hypothetical protein
MPAPRRFEGVNGKVRLTAVNHVALAIARGPDRVYQEIVADYVGGAKFGAVTPLPDADLAACRGGYRIAARDGEGVLVDDRICRITERDDLARRISLAADYLVPEQIAMQVHATYQAVPDPIGTLYRVDCHTGMTIELPADSGREAAAALVADFERQSDEVIHAYLIEVRDRLEAQES